MISNIQRLSVVSPSYKDVLNKEGPFAFLPKDFIHEILMRSELHVSFSKRSTTSKRLKIIKSFFELRFVSKVWRAAVGNSIFFLLNKNRIRWESQMENSLGVIRYLESSSRKNALTTLNLIGLDVVLLPHFKKIADNSPLLEKIYLSSWCPFESLTQLANLKTIHMEKTAFPSAITSLTQLENLSFKYCSNNASSLDLAKMRLKTYKVHAGQLTQFTSKLPATLEFIHLGNSWVPLDMSFDSLVNLKKLSMNQVYPSTQLARSTIVKLNLNKTHFPVDYFKYFPALEALKIESSYFSPDLSCLKNLKKLFIIRGKSAFFEAINTLTTLKLSESFYNSNALSGLKNLIYLEIFNSKVKGPKTLNLNSLEKLFRVKIISRHLTSLNAKRPNIREIGINCPALKTIKLCKTSPPAIDYKAINS